MTKNELAKCEKLCIEAIRDMKEANDLYREAEKIDKEFHKATVELRRADNKRGYAEGIYQALESLGYSSESMKKLNELM